MTDLAYSAMVFARRVHAQQQRKYTGTSYSDHLAEVAACEHLTADQSIVLRARHLAKTAEGLRAAHADSQTEALHAHQFVADLLRQAVLDAEGGVA